MSYSFLRHLGKENVAKNAKGQQMLRTKAVSYTLLDQFMTESRFQLLLGTVVILQQSFSFAVLTGFVSEISHLAFSQEITVKFM